MKPTVNPLVYTVSLTFQSPPSGKQKMLVWNLIQQYASKNDSVLHDRPVFLAHSLHFSVGVKRRLGREREEDPWA